VYEYRWNEASAGGPGMKGWYWKKMCLIREQPSTFQYSGTFGVYGRLMFVHHDQRAPFGLSRFAPETPRNRQQKILAPITIGVPDENKKLLLYPGYQIFLSYSDDMVFHGTPTAAFLVGEGEVRAATMAAEEAMTEQIARLHARNESEVVRIDGEEHIEAVEELLE
jgi:hypothetical protein